MEIILHNILPGLAIAVATAWITVRLSLGRFRTERWWERKVEAYSDVLEKLVDTYTLAKRLQLRRDSDNPSFKEGALSDVGELATGLSDLRREVTRGSFLIRADALSKIEVYLDASARKVNDFIEDGVERIPGLIDEVRRIAKDDLSVL